MLPPPQGRSRIASIRVLPIPVDLHNYNTYCSRNLPTIFKFFQNTTFFNIELLAKVFLPNYDHAPSPSTYATIHLSYIPVCSVIHFKYN